MFCNLSGMARAFFRERPVHTAKATPLRQGLQKDSTPAPPQPGPQTVSTVTAPGDVSLAVPTWTHLRQRANDAEAELRMLCLSPNAGAGNASDQDAFFRRMVQSNWTEVCIRLIKENTPISNRMLATLFASTWTSMSMHNVIDEGVIKLRRNDLLQLIMDGQPGRLPPELLISEAKRRENPEIAAAYKKLLSNKQRDRAAFDQIVKNRKRLIHQQLDEHAAPYRAARDFERNARGQTSCKLRTEAQNIFTERCWRCGIDPARPAKGLRDAQWHAPFNQSLDVYWLPDGISALVWREGRHAGKIFELADTKAVADLRESPTVEGFKNNVIELLFVLDQPLMKSKFPWQKSKAKIDLHTSITRCYYEGTAVWN